MEKVNCLYVIKTDKGSHVVVFGDDDDNAIKLAVKHENTYGHRDSKNGEVVQKTSKPQSLNALPYGMTRLPSIK